MSLEEEEKMPEQSLVSLRRVFLWLCIGVCCLAMSACGGNTVSIYDNAHVLSTLTVHNAAANLSQNVNVYTFNNFHGKQSDFYPAVVAKLGLSPNTVLLVIDTVHPSIYVLRGASVNLPRSDITKATNAFTATYPQAGYTNATVSALNSLRSTLNANHSSPFLPLFWLIPLVLLVGALLFVVLRARRRSYEEMPRRDK